MKNHYNLDTSLLKIGDAHWTIRNSVEGLQIFGGIGSGKTSGSGRFFALKYLAHGYGGLVLTVKPDEKDEWIKYCKEANREDDLIIVEPKGEHFFNFLDYEASQYKDQFYTENILQVLKTVIRASEEKTNGKSDDRFWETALDMLISCTIDLCILAYGNVTVKKLYDLVFATSKLSEIQDDEDFAKNEFVKAMELAKKNIIEKRESWNITLSESMSIEELSKITSEEFSDLLVENISELRAFNLLEEFFTQTYAELSEKTRSIVEFSFTGFLFSLLKDPVYSLFCRKKSTFLPEDCLNGKIIIINLPIKTYHKVGRDVQIMFKYIWQRAIERRNVKSNGRPVFLWADEAQNFLHEYDSEYQATARSSRIATVYITQNLPNYFANMGGSKYEFKVKSFLGTLASKIFHANADTETNLYASDLVGQAYREDRSQSTTTVDGKTSISESVSYKLDKLIRPEEFHTLLTGGEPNDFKVTSYLHVQGMKFPGGKNYHRLLFNQQYTLK